MRAERWVEETDALTQSTWKMRTTEDPLWETKWDYIVEWQRNTLVMTTSGYHNLVVHWNVGTLPHGLTNPPRTMECTMYYLTDDDDTLVMPLSAKHTQETPLQAQVGRSWF